MKRKYPLYALSAETDMIVQFSTNTYATVIRPDNEGKFGIGFSAAWKPCTDWRCWTIVSKEKNPEVFI